MVALEMAHAVIKSHKLNRAHTATMTHCATYANYEILKVLQILFSGVSRSVLPRPIVFNQCQTKSHISSFLALKSFFYLNISLCNVSLYV